MYSKISLKKRIFVCSLVFVLVGMFLVYRLYYIQIYSSENLKAKAVDQWLRDIPTSAKRGTIYDTNGAVVVESKSCYNIYVRHALVENAESEAQQYSSILELDYNFVLEKLNDYSLSENLLTSNVPKDKVVSLLDAGLKSFVASERFERNYQYDSLLSQIVGFTSSDGNGLSGVEYAYNQYLKGSDGLVLADGDARGKEIENSKTYYVPSIDGFDVVLTIDLSLQAKVEEIMKNALNSTGAKSVSALVTNPQTGEILSVVTLPSYDLNNIPRDNLSELNDLSRSFVINDTYEPGSTFKSVVAAIAIDLGVANINTGYYCPGYRIVDGVRTNCHKKTGHGSQTLTTGFVNSCNCVFMQVVSDIGIDKFYEYVSKFHFDELLGIDYPGEASGIIIDKNSAIKNDFLRMGFGQSIAISGLQLASAISAICTDGYLKRPYLIKSIMSPDGDTILKNSPTRISKVVNGEVAKSMQYMMEQVVLKGGGKASAVEGHTVGGKTGTAQKYENGAISKGNYIGSYICVSPVENPEYLVLVIIDEPKTSIYGNIVATPVAGEILRAIYGASQGASNEEMVEVPDLVGKTLTEASAILAGLELYFVIEGEGQYVIHQSVEPHKSVVKHSSIMIKF